MANVFSYISVSESSEFGGEVSSLIFFRETFNSVIVPLVLFL